MPIDWDEYVKRTNSEHAHQVALFGWTASNVVQIMYPELRFLFSIPNGFVGKAEKAKMKAEGLKPGVPDIMLPIPRAFYHGLFIEMKKPAMNGEREGQTRPEQKVWLAYLESVGYRTTRCYGFHEARQTLLSYLDLPKSGAAW